MGEIDLSSIQSDSVVDARGVSCPGPLLKAKKGMGSIQIGQILEIMSNDPGSKNDIPDGQRRWDTIFLDHWAWLALTGCLSSGRNRRGKNGGRN